MQSNLRLLIWTLVGILAVWFIVMSADVYLFTHSDADEVVYGTVAMNRTDIGDRCGTAYVNSPTLIDFKLNSQGQIVYLCPLGVSPVRETVVAMTIPDMERRGFTPAQQAKINATYPVAAGNGSPVPQPEAMNAGTPQAQVQAARSVAPQAVLQGQVPQAAPPSQPVQQAPVPVQQAPANQMVPQQQPTAVPVQQPPMNQTPTPQAQVPEAAQPPINQTPTPAPAAQAPQPAMQPPINQTPVPQQQQPAMQQQQPPVNQTAPVPAPAQPQANQMQNTPALPSPSAGTPAP
jgi:hypothetical protein